MSLVAHCAAVADKIPALFPHVRYHFDTKLAQLFYALCHGFKPCGDANALLIGAKYCNAKRYQSKNL
jgi:hypothetical protein